MHTRKRILSLIDIPDLDYGEDDKPVDWELLGIVIDQLSNFIKITVEADGMSVDDGKEAQDYINSISNIISI